MVMANNNVSDSSGRQAYDVSMTKEEDVDGKSEKRRNPPRRRMLESSIKMIQERVRNDPGLMKEVAEAELKQQSKIAMTTPVEPNTSCMSCQLL